MAGPRPKSPRIEIIFRKGRPVAAFFHFSEEESGRTGRQIPIRPQLTAHYNQAGHPSGLEVPLPLTVTAAQISDALRELSQPPIEESDLLMLRSV
ncbi:MAG: hypothetical protein U0271_14115 [Polyangiaceae bacterium]